MTKTNQSAEKGEQFLLYNHEKYRLEVEYDFDCDTIFIQLKDKDSGTCTVLDGSDIFRQVHEHFNKANSEQEKRYRLTMNGQDFTGTATDIARWYCKQKGIKLYIEPDGISKGNPQVLWAEFSEGKPLTHIAYFENEPSDIETGYALFFSEFLNDGAPEPDDGFTITQCS